jgi:hypothetical protein
MYPMTTHLAKFVTPEFRVSTVWEDQFPKGARRLVI